MSTSETLKKGGRIAKIIQILSKYGFEDIISNSTLRNLVTEKQRLAWMRKNKPVLQYTRWERMRMCAEELGPTFVKMAQILSIRPDIIPEPLIKEFEKLQDRVAPFPFAQVKEIIERESGKELNELFDYFKEEPLASASIGQVHRAKIKGGDEVVVKIQRPGVAELVERDLGIITWIVGVTERYLKKQGMLNPKDVVRAFERSILKELDYTNEGRNIEKFKNFYRNHTNFYIPGAYRELSTEKVLIIEYAEGCKINDAVQLKAWGIDPHKIAENGMAIYLTQIFEYGYFHADPHPGNVLVRRDGTICLIDFGMVGRLMPSDKTHFANVFISIAQRDAAKMAMSLKKLSISDEIEDMRAFQYDLNEIIEDFVDLDVSEGSIADMTTRLQKVMFDYKISVPGGIFLIFRAFAILEGIGKQIHPHFNTYEFIKPYGRKLIEQHFKPKQLAKDLTSRFEQVSELLTDFPKDAKELLGKAKKGKLHFVVEHQGYGYLLKKLDSLTNRLVITFIIVALIIGASISMLATWPADQMTKYGISYITAIELIAAACLFLILFYSVVRRRKYK